MFFALLAWTYQVPSLQNPINVFLLKKPNNLEAPACLSLLSLVSCITLLERYQSLQFPNIEKVSKNFVLKCLLGGTDQMILKHYHCWQSKFLVSSYKKICE